MTANRDERARYLLRATAQINCEGVEADLSMMIRRLTISTMLFVLVATANVAANVRGTLKTATAERFVELELDRTPIVEFTKGKRVERGWRYLGSYQDTIQPRYGQRSQPDQEFHFKLYGATKNYFVTNGDSTTIVLEEKLYRESRTDTDRVTGRLIGRVDEKGDFVGIWQTLDGATSYPFVLVSDGSIGEDPFDTDERVHIDVAFLDYWAKFRQGVRTRDYKALAPLIEFPFRDPSCIVQDWFDLQRRSLTRRQFLRYGDSVFDARVYPAMISLAPLEAEPTHAWPDGAIEDVDPGTMVYEVSFNPYSEYSLIFYFARVGGRYKLVHLTCVG